MIKLRATAVHKSRNTLLIVSDALQAICFSPMILERSDLSHFIRGFDKTLTPGQLTPY